MLHTIAREIAGDASIDGGGTPARARGERECALHRPCRFQVTRGDDRALEQRVRKIAETRWVERMRGGIHVERAHTRPVEAAAPGKLATVRTCAEALEVDG